MLAVAEKEIEDMSCEPLRNNLYRLLSPHHDDDEDESAHVPELSFHDGMEDLTIAAADIISGYLHQDLTSTALVNQATGKEDHGVLSEEDEDELDEDDWSEEEDDDNLAGDNIGVDESTVDFNRPTEEIEIEEDDSIGATVTMTVGGGEKLKVTRVGKKIGTVVQRDGSKKRIILNNVKYVPDLSCNILSLTQALQGDFVMTGDKKSLKIGKGGVIYVFDRKVLSGIKIADDDVSTSDNKDAFRKTAYVQLHAQLGHPGLDRTRATA